MTMYEITFKYKDAWSHGRWNTQSCVVGSVGECIRIYGLNEPDVEYEIVSVKKVGGNDDEN